MGYREENRFVIKQKYNLLFKFKMKFLVLALLWNPRNKATLCRIVSMRANARVLHLDEITPSFESHCHKVSRGYNYEVTCWSSTVRFWVEQYQRPLCVWHAGVCGEQNVHRKVLHIYIGYAIHLLSMWDACKCVPRRRYAVFLVSESYRMDMSRGWGVEYWCLSALRVSEWWCSLLNRKQGVPCWTRA